jgi:hypothetical protein
VTDPDERVITSTASVDRLDQRNIRYQRIRTGIVAVAAAAIVAAVVIFGLINSHKQDTANGRLKAAATCQPNVSPIPPICAILKGVQDATDPNSAFSRANAAKGLQASALAIACLENHEDRLIAGALDRPLPALLTGCPSLPLLKPATPTPAPPRASSAARRTFPAPLPVRFAPVVPAVATTVAVARHGKGHHPKRHK